MIAAGPAAKRPPHILFPASFPEPLLPRPASSRLPSLTPCALAALLAAGGCDRQTASPPQPEATAIAKDARTGSTTPFNGTLSIENRGALMPDFTLVDPAGRRLRLAELRGKPVLLNLW